MPNAFVDVPTHARFLVVGDEVGLFVPLAEIGPPPELATFRGTAFWHSGAFGLNGGEWSGSYFPALDQPLLPIAHDLVLTPE